MEDVRHLDELEYVLWATKGGVKYMLNIVTCSELICFFVCLLSASEIWELFQRL